MERHLALAVRGKLGVCFYLAIGVAVRSKQVLFKGGPVAEREETLRVRLARNVICHITAETREDVKGFLFFGSEYALAKERVGVY